MIKDSKRLGKIVDCVQTKIVLDVGCDHGYTLKKLYDTKKIDISFALDVSQKSLNKAQINLENYKDKTFFYTGFGLNPITQNIEEINRQLRLLGQKDLFSVPNEVIISGLGGQEIIKILSTSKDFKNFILQPQNNSKLLKLYLIQNNFKIEKDVIVKDEKMFYNVIYAIRQNKKFVLDDFQLEFCKIDLMSKDFLEYIKFKKNLYENILKTKRVEDIERKLLLIKENVNV